MQIRAWLVALGIIVVAAMVSLVAIDLQRERGQRIDEAFRHLGSLARTLEEHAIRTLHGTDLLLVNVAEAVEDSGGPRAPNGEVARLLARSARLAPHVQVLLVYDHDGQVVHSSHTPAPNGPDFADHAGTGMSDGLRIGLFERGPEGIGTTIVLSRPVRDADGVFAGGIVALVEAEYFTDFYESVRFGDEGTILLVRDDGLLLVRAPTGSVTPGGDLSGHPAFRQIEADGASGQLETIDPNGGIVDLVAHRSLDAYPVRVVVAAERKEVLAGYRRHLSNSFITLSVLTVAIGLFLFYIVVQVARNQRTTQALNLQKSYFQQLFDGSPEGIVILDNADRIVDANRAFQRIFQYDIEEARWRTLNELILPEHLQSEGSDLSQRVLEEQAVQAETLRRRKDGSLVHVSILGVPVKLHDDQVGVYGIYRDISERIEAERVLRESEERHRVVAEQTGQVIYDYDVISGQITWSGAIRKITGYDYDEFQAIDIDMWASMIHPDDRDLAVNTLDERMKTGGHYNVEYRFRRKNGSWVAIEDNGTFLRNDEGVTYRMLGSMSDVTERKRITSEMAWQASHDALTGLVNRHEFEERVARLLFNRRGQRRHAMLYIDLDQFKLVNDTCGHQAGDQLLRQLTGLVAVTVRESDTLSRLGGDEFGLLLVDCPLDQAVAISEKLISTINEFRFVWDDQTFSIGASIGLVEITKRTESVAALFSAADSACYTAKDKGRNRVVVYHESDRDLAARHGEMTWVSRINKALEENRFVIHRQAIERMAAPDDGRAHCELLVRMVDEDGALVPPGEFIPAAERYNIMPSLDRWVIRNVFRKLVEQGDDGVMVAINLSGTTLSSEHFVSYVHEQIRESKVSPEAVCYEITETAAIANVARAREFIDEMHGLGCKISLDDFGSGLSSFAYLKSLQVDFIKIDGTFVKDIAEDQTDQAMVEAIVRVGQVMGIHTIAEFVETEAVFKLLERIGVDYVQGLYLDKPRPWLG